MLLLLLSCAGSADVTVDDAPGCGLGFELGEDGRCYEEVDADTADPADADTDTDTDADTDSDVEPEDLDEDGYSVAAGDCDDVDPTVSPDAEETCNEVDDNCNGEIDEDLEHAWYRDRDDDGYGDRNDSMSSCEAPRGYVGSDQDCDDSDGGVYPGAADDTGDGIDNDCDGAIDEDWDPCSVASGAMSWLPTGTLYPDTGITSVVLDGAGLVCAVTCSASWVGVDGYGAPYTACGAYTLPYDATAGLGVCLQVTDPGTDYEEATCSAYTSAGTVDLLVVWN
jgi:hypothetical protein